MENNKQSPIGKAVAALVAELQKLPPAERAGTAAQLAILMENTVLALVEKHPEITGA